jgi:hypothetical protein
VLLPSDTHNKYILSITAVLLPFEAYLLILPRIWENGGIVPPFLSSALDGGGQFHAPAASHMTKQLPMPVV